MRENGRHGRGRRRADTGQHNAGERPQRKVKESVSTVVILPPKDERISKAPAFAGAFRVSKKWLKTTFSSFCGFCLSHSFPSGKTRKVRKPPVFIRFDAHVVKAGINLRGCGPLTTPRFFDRLKGLRFLGGAPYSV